MSDSPTPAPRPNIDLVTGLFTLFSDNLGIVRNWGFYLFSSEFDDEPALRNRIGVVWLTSLLDSLEGELRSLETYRRMANERGLPHLLEVCDQASLFMDCVKDISRRYSREEQIFLADMRDQLVHSWLARRHSPQFHIKYFDGDVIVKERLTPSEHADIVPPFYFADVLDVTLSALLERFRDLRLRYWHVIDELARTPDLERAQDEMLSGRPFRVDALTRNISGPVAFRFG
jgi:hypothetical protein